ncbi:LPXTG-motif cell wall-anchored protein [Crossiella equi]|uniref:LPXTG-motif cell wall-anchored protein n=1 Tax=Crossiella equi TaxID=130796 RepID=A0ABS5AHM9_9PSEU|nr:trypsin-like serine protease [Crossiella equi]MBP2475734.1 LPXTG-motif cell wall-anchored protein [Crossiella equi]
MRIGAVLAVAALLVALLPAAARAEEDVPPGLAEAVRRDLGKDVAAHLDAARAADSAARTALRLRRELGERFGGAWFEDGLHVAVTDAASAARVRAAGGQAHQRPVSAAALDRAVVLLGRWARTRAHLVPAIAVDARGGRLLVTRTGPVDLPPVAVPVVTVLREELPQLERDLQGGDGVQAGVRACTLGFTAVDRLGRGRVLTARHCFAADRRALLPGGEPLGLADEDGPGGDDAVVVRVGEGHRLRPGVGGLRLTGVTEPLAGQEVCKSGRTTGWQCGRVTSAQVRVSLEGRALTVLAHTACGRPGDSGGPLLSGRLALGITTGGAPNRGSACAGDVSYAEPLARDVLPDFRGDAALTLLTENGDADGDGLPDLAELGPNLSEPRDTNGNGVAAYRDADEPELAAPRLTSPADGARTTVRRAVLSGTAKPNSTVLLTFRGRTTELRVDSAGKWLRPATGDEPFGTHEITLRQRQGGATSRAAVFRFALVPPPPEVTEPRPGTRGPAVAGTALPGALVTVHAGETPLGESTAAANGWWSVPLPPTATRVRAAQTLSGATSDPTEVAFGHAEQPVPPSSAPSGTGGLARTGTSGGLWLAGVGALAVLGGGVLLRRSRRRSFHGR